MAKSKIVEEVVPEPETEPIPEPVIDPVAERLAAIESMYPNIVEVVPGVKIDPKKADHRLVAAWLIGRRGMLRR